MDRITCEDYVVNRLMDLEEDYDKQSFENDVLALEVDEARTMVRTLIGLIEHSHDGEENDKFEMSIYKKYDREEWGTIQQCVETVQRWSGKKAEEAESDSDE